LKNSKWLLENDKGLQHVLARIEGFEQGTRFTVDEEINQIINDE
jgi:hypothetical protein